MQRWIKAGVEQQDVGGYYLCVVRVRSRKRVCG
jgi:hypothetical protein